MYRLIALFFLSVATAASAAPDPRQLASEIQGLYNAGRQTPPGNALSDAQLGQCAREQNPKRDRLKAIRKEAMAVEEYSNRMALVSAADEAFACLYCAGDRSACVKVPAQLDKVGK